MKRRDLPFAAVVGQEASKKALLCALSSPDINGVLLIGERGTAKSRLAHSLSDLLPGKRVIHLPLNATEDRVVGSIDLEAAMVGGERAMMPGLLYEAQDQILCIDEINLLEESIVDMVIDAADSGVNHVEREGISWSHPCRFILVATMDPTEGELSPHTLDRFDLCVEMSSLKDPDERREIIRRYLKFEEDPVGFVEGFEEENEEIRMKLARSRELLPYVLLPEGHLELISRLSLELGVKGHRGDLAVARTARTLAALDDRDHVLLEDIRGAASLALEHRRTPEQESPPEMKSPMPEGRSSPEDGPPSGDEERQDRAQESEPSPETDPLSDLDDVRPPTDPGPETVFSVGDSFVVIDYLGHKRRERRKVSKGIGRRERVLSPERSGRYVSFRLPHGKVRDLAFDATLRAAAPFQRWRERGDLAIALTSSDLREKVRLRKRGTTLLFLVDASGSMGAKQRMTAVKGAIFSLLDDAYRKRDAVGMMVFRGESTELLLPPTRSVDLAYRKLRELPTGGRTPLAMGLRRAVGFMDSWKLRAPEEDPVIVIISDGRANVSMGGGGPIQEALQVARQAAFEPIRFIVVDTEMGFPRIDLAQKICSELEGTYFRLEELDASFLASSVRAVVHGS